MPAPATTGVERASISDMKKYDFVKIHCVQDGKFMIGDGGLPECPVIGVQNGSHLGYYFYVVKVDTGLLIADRVWNVQITWNTLNTNKMIEGTPVTIDGESGYVLRSLSGGVAYSDAYGQSKLNSDQYGAFPTTNEWDKYIVNFPTKKIKNNYTIDDIFHWNNSVTWCKDTPVNNVLSSNGTTLGSNSRRIARGYSDVAGLYLNESNQSFSSYGFRPVFEYKEVI